MKRLHSLSAVALTGIVGFSALIAPMAASASEQGKKNTALGLGALAAGLLLTQKNKLTGVLAAGGAAYAYSQYDKDVKNRHRREQYGYYDDRSNNGYRTNRDNNNDSYRQNSNYRDNNNDQYNRNGSYRDNNDEQCDQDNRNHTYRDNNNDRYTRDDDNRTYGDSGQSDGYRYRDNGRSASRSAGSRSRSNDNSRRTLRRAGDSPFTR